MRGARTWFGGSGRARLRPNVATLLHLCTLYLFYVQPGVDRPALLRWMQARLPSGLMLPLVSAAMACVGWGFGAGGMYLIYWLQAPFFERFRIQAQWNFLSPDEKKRRPAVELRNQTLAELRKELLVGPWFAFAAVYFMVLPNHPDLEAYIDSVPQWHVSFVRIMAGCLMFETAFYWGHRLQHTIPSWYYHHKVHHMYFQPMGATGLWGSQWEKVASLFLPGVVPILVLQFHVYEFWMWMIIHQFHSVYDHCGYDFPWSPLQLIPLSGFGTAHNFHHWANQGNYGLYWRFWDSIMGTDSAWLTFEAQAAADRQRLLAGMAPSDAAAAAAAAASKDEAAAPPMHNGAHGGRAASIAAS